ncbi:MAG: hypothetical protein PHI35_04460 [Victivallaceae bacterium]|nr:hypothetical protein [Victivallaceae bacterium]
MKPFDRDKYLRRSVQKLVEPRPLPPDREFYVVIPACDELAYIDGVLTSLAEAGAPGCAAVLVAANHPADASGAVKEATSELCRRLAGHSGFGAWLYLLTAPDLTDGVGEARKLGMDAVIAALPPEFCDRAVLVSLDADCRVEPDYFECWRNGFAANPAAGAMVCGVRHQTGASPEEEAAIRRYEEYMADYTRRLAEAGSPYAFPTVGSAFAVRAASYIRSGGMRKRSGGEDFYFLQAAAKTVGVAELDAVLVHPSPRSSARVPFGTGPAVAAILGGQPPRRISDGAFSQLAKLLQTAARPGMLSSTDGFLTGLDAKTAGFLRETGFERDWTRILANTPNQEKARLAAFHRYFDGLASLRLLHELDEV